jgi:hypothetical protein
MNRRTYRVLALLACMAAFCGSLSAQAWQVIIVRMLDSKTGKLIQTSDFLVRVDHDSTVHANWVTQNEDGTGKLTVPKDASLLAIQGKYDSSTQIYINCDSAAEKENPSDHWYAVSTILTSGIVAPNGCVKPSDAAKIKPVAKPGEFVFFVRKHNWREQMDDDFSSR